MKATFLKDFAGIKKGQSANLSDYTYSSLKEKGIIGDAVNDEVKAEEPKKRRRKKSD